MRYLTIAEVLETYQRVMQQTGGLVGIRDLGALESAIAQPNMTFIVMTTHHPISNAADTLNISPYTTKSKK
jgi:death-on-curing protein